MILICYWDNGHAGTKDFKSFENIHTIDPLNASIFSIDKLSEICDKNEINAAKIVLIQS